MIDLAEVDTGVNERAVQFNARQALMNVAKDALRRDLYRAFYQLWPGRAGDRIQVSFGRVNLDGRAVILLNGTRMGLYLDHGGQRHAVPEPYSDHVRNLSRKHH